MSYQPTAPKRRSIGPPRQPADGTAPEKASVDRDDDVYERFDASGLRLLEEVVDAAGFDPYGHATLRAKAPAASGRTDLRALSAQILAERARKSRNS